MMRSCLLVMAAMVLCAGQARATVYEVSFTGRSTFAFSAPTGAGVTYSAPSGDGATVAGSYTFNTTDPSATPDGKGGTFYAGAVGSLTFSNVVNVPSSSFTFTSPRVILDVTGLAAGGAVSVSLAPGVIGNTTDIVWVDNSHFEIKHLETNGFELNRFSTLIKGIAVVAAVPEPASLGLYGLGLAIAGLVAGVGAGAGAGVGRRVQETAAATVFPPR